MAAIQKTALDWAELRNRQEKAISQAEGVLRGFGLLSDHVDPVVIVELECPILKIAGGNFGNRFDGQLEYHRSKNRFVLFFNDKYDASYTGGAHHPRTRFSIAHELGHYYLPSHHAYLRQTGKAHASRGEFLSDRTIETEADAFAAGLLLPTEVFRPMVNEGDLTLAAVEEWAKRFETSITCTARRAVDLSDFPCAVVSIRDGRISSAFHSQPLIDGGCYPRSKGSSLPPPVTEKWEAFVAGKGKGLTGQAFAKDWFQVYGRRDEEHAPVYEYYHPVPASGTLLVLLTVPEEELFPEDGDNDDD
jgi:hypothetical protein